MNDFWEMMAAEIFNRPPMKRHGLSKAERAAIRRDVRRAVHVPRRELENMNNQFQVIARAEMRKRWFTLDAERECYTRHFGLARLMERLPDLRSRVKRP